MGLRSNPAWKQWEKQQPRFFQGTPPLPKLCLHHPSYAQPESPSPHVAVLPRFQAKAESSLWNSVPLQAAGYLGLMRPCQAPSHGSLQRVVWSWVCTSSRHHGRHHGWVLCAWRPCFPCMGIWNKLIMLYCVCMLFWLMYRRKDKISVHKLQILEGAVDSDFYGCLNLMQIDRQFLHKLNVTCGSKQ